MVMITSTGQPLTHQTVRTSHRKPKQSRPKRQQNPSTHLGLYPIVPTPRGHSTHLKTTLPINPSTLTYNSNPMGPWGYHPLAHHPLIIHTFYLQPHGYLIRGLRLSWYQRCQPPAQRPLHELDQVVGIQNQLLQHLC